MKILKLGKELEVVTFNDFVQIGRELDPDNTGEFEYKGVPFRYEDNIYYCSFFNLTHDKFIGIDDNDNLYMLNDNITDSRTVYNDIREV